MYNLEELKEFERILTNKWADQLDSIADQLEAETEGIQGRAVDGYLASVSVIRQAAIDMRESIRGKE